MRDDSGYRIVGYLFALCQVDFENIRAVEGEGCDRGVGYILAAVEFELLLKLATTSVN